MVILKKSIPVIFIEATVVGICLVLFINLILYFKNKDISWKKDQFELYFIAGFLFHIVFELTGINMWYAKEYCKII